MEMSVLPVAAHDQQSDSETLLQPVREALPYSYQSWIVVYILQDSTGKINIFLPDLTIFLPPPAPCICLQQGELRAPERGSLLAAAPKVTKNAA